MTALSAGRRRLAKGMAILATVAVMTAAASQAWASIPHSTTGVITSCYNSTGALRVVDAQQGASCSAGETPLTWNTTPITATRWGSNAVKPLTRAPGVPEVVLLDPGSPLPAGSWIVTTTVMIANSQELNTFRCWTRTRSTLLSVGGQVQEWGSAQGWHHTMTIPGLVTITGPDWIDVYCSHDSQMSLVGVVQVEAVDVIVQRVAATF